jgi:predicted regulator of Ras-like GTPase activity (Roadblock/LC7/MglB family)
VASAIGASEMIGNDFEMGMLEQYLLEFETGKAIIAAAGTEILVVITDATAIIGSARYAVKKNIDRIVALL